MAPPIQQQIHLLTIGARPKKQLQQLPHGEEARTTIRLAIRNRAPASRQGHNRISRN